MSDRRRERENRPESPDDRFAADLRQTLPAAIEAEQAVLCAAFLDPQGVIEEISARLPAEHFHHPAHKVLWEQVVEMQRQRKPVDLVTVTQWLHDRQLLEICGGAPYLAAIFTTHAAHASNVHSHAELVREKHVLREVIRISSEATSQAYVEQDDVKGILERIVTSFVELAATSAGEGSIRHIRQFALAAINEIEYAYANRGKTVGLPTGFVDLDRQIGGWQKGLTYYFGARPGMGKTSLGLNFAAETASASAEVGAPTLIFSLEMTGTQLAKRLIFTDAKINQQKARDGFLSREKDWEGLMRAANAVANSHIEVDETAALTIADFRARARAWIKKIRRARGVRKDGKPDGLIVIDYLQRMKGSSRRSETARYLELQEISQGISAVAKDLLIPIIILAQLGRPKEKKPDAEPTMVDFRECGDIEQEAHVVGLLHRPDYYVHDNHDKRTALAEKMQERFRAQASWQGQSEEEVENITFTIDDLARYAKLIIDKQRDGPVGSVDLRFIGDYTLFETWDVERKLYSNNKRERQAPAHVEEGA